MMKLFDFYSTIASQTPAHIFIYNFPERTGYSVSPEICLRLADKYPNIIGMKDTVPDAFHTAQVINTVKKNILILKCMQDMTIILPTTYYLVEMAVLVVYPILSLNFCLLDASIHE